MIKRLGRSRKGFTLVELLVVIVVLAVLGAIVVPKFVGAGKAAKESALKTDLQMLRQAIQMFRSDTGYYPAQLSDLAASTAPANGLDTAGSTKAILAADYKGPYVVSVPTDPVSGAAFGYSTASGSVGNVSSSATGTATDGTNYSDW